MTKTVKSPPARRIFQPPRDEITGAMQAPIDLGKARISAETIESSESAIFHGLTEIRKGLLMLKLQLMVVGPREGEWEALGIIDAALVHLGRGRRVTVGRRTVTTAGPPSPADNLVYGVDLTVPALRRAAEILLAPVKTGERRLALQIETLARYSARDPASAEAMLLHFAGHGPPSEPMLARNEEWRRAYAPTEEERLADELEGSRLSEEEYACTLNAADERRVRALAPNEVDQAMDAALALVAQRTALTCPDARELARQLRGHCVAPKRGRLPAGRYTTALIIQWLTGKRPRVHRRK